MTNFPLRMRRISPGGPTSEELMSATKYPFLRTRASLGLDYGKNEEEGSWYITQPFVIRYGCNGQLTYANPAYCAYLQLSPENLLGTNFIHRVPLDEMPRISRELTTLSYMRPQIILQHHMLMADGAKRLQLWLHRLLQGRDRNPEYLAIGRDITGMDHDCETLDSITLSLQRMQASLTGTYPPPVVQQGAVSHI